MLVDLDTLSLVIGCCAGMIAVCAVVITIIALQHKNVTELRKEVLEINKIEHEHGMRMNAIDRIVERLRLDDLVKLLDALDDEQRVAKLNAVVLKRAAENILFEDIDTSTKKNIGITKGGDTHGKDDTE